MIIDDLHRLSLLCCGKFDELPDPRVDPSPYFALAAKFPGEWKMLAKKVLVAEDDVECSTSQKRQAEQSTEALEMQSFVCYECGAICKSYRALCLHKRVKHNQRCFVDAFIDDVSKCSICGTDFQSRIRLVQHLRLVRVWSSKKGFSCNSKFLENLPECIPAVRLAMIHVRDGIERKRARMEYTQNSQFVAPCVKARRVEPEDEV